MNRFAENPVRSLSKMSNSGTVRHSSTHSMPWPHRFITVDQNQLRHPDRIARLLDDCCRSGLHVLLPDGAFLEFAKSGYFADTTRQSLRLLAPYRELVAAGCKLSHLMSSELQGRVPAIKLTHDGATEFLRSILDDLDHSEDAALLRLANGPVKELIPPALDVWNDHDRNKKLVQGLHDALKADMPSDQLKALRRSPDEGIAQWTSSLAGTRFIFQGLKRRGADDATAYELTRTPSVNAGFLSALAALAVYWVAKGGVEGSKNSGFSGDLTHKARGTRPPWLNPAWSAREDRIVRSKTPAEAARLTGRTLSAVKNRRNELRRER